MPTNIDTQTLYTLNYSNVPQLVEDLNRNFAIIQNSPLFKGIPGTPGFPGNPGPLGVRGSKILFVDVNVFIEKFPNEIRIGSDITLDYLQLKMDEFYSKQVLLEIWKLDEFVNQDIIVLTNSTMLQYVNNVLSNTGISFREETTILSNIEKVIEDKVKYYVENNPTILGLKNVFNTFDSIYKNYADTNNVHVNNTLLQSSIIAPYVPGYSNNIGIKADSNDGIKKDHTYFGFSDSLFNVHKAGTIVFGAIARYSQMLLASVSTSQQGTLTSDYVPGVNNMPIAIFMQEDPNSGLLIGKKTDSNLMRFASIYKDAMQTLIIKSDSSKNPNEYSAIELSKNSLVYRKIVIFHDELTVGGKFKLSGDIQSPYIKTGTEIYPTDSGVISGPKKIQIGYRDVANGTIPNDAAIDLITKNIVLSNLTTTNTGRTVLTTGQTDGKISTQYSIDTRMPSATEYFGITKYTMFNQPYGDVDRNWIVTSNQLFGVQSKINGLIDYITDDSTGYWRKNQHDTGEIPSIQIGNSFKSTKDNSMYIGGINKDNSWLYRQATDVNIVNFGFPVAKDSRINMKFDQLVLEEYQAGLVLVTEGGGLVSKKYIIFDNSELTEVKNFNIDDSDNFKFLNKTHFQYLLGFTKQEITQLTTDIANNYWNKNQFKATVPVIPTLRLINDLYSDSFKVNGINLDVGRTTLTGSIKLLNKLELTTADGISVPAWNSGTPTGDASWSHKAVGVKDNKIVQLGWRFPNIIDIRNRTMATIYTTEYVTPEAWNTESKQNILQDRILTENWWWWLLNKVDKLYSIVQAPKDDNDFNTNDDRWSYWTKSDFANSANRPIPGLYLAGVLDTSGVTFNFGKLDDRTIQGNGTSLVLGTSGGVVTLRNQVEYPRYKNTFIMTKTDGIVDDTQRIPLTTYPKPSEVFTEVPYSKDDTTPDRNRDFAVEETKDGLIAIPTGQQMLTLKWAEWISKFINGMKDTMKRIYSAARVENRITTRLYEHLPVGSIIMFSPYIDIPTGAEYDWWGWAICDGTPVVRGGQSYNVPDLRDRFISAVGSKADAGKTGPTQADANATGFSIRELENHVYIKGSELPNHSHAISIEDSGSNYTMHHSHGLGDGVTGTRTLYAPFFLWRGGSNIVDQYSAVTGHKHSGAPWPKKAWCEISADVALAATDSNARTTIWGGVIYTADAWTVLEERHWSWAVNKFNETYAGGITVATKIYSTDSAAISFNTIHTHLVSSVTGPSPQDAKLFKMYIKQYSLVYLMKVPMVTNLTDTVVTGFNQTTAENIETQIKTKW